MNRYMKLLNVAVYCIDVFI